MIKGIEYKSILTSTKDAIMDVDEAKGIIEGYFAVFGNKDSDKDVLRPGFFTKTLQENGKRVKHLYQHDPWKPLSGVKNGNLILEQDSYGLKYISTVSKTSYGKDVIRLHLDGVIDENSFGFQTTQSKDVLDANGNFEYRELIEGVLWEGSSVTWGANMLATNTSAKSLNKDELFKKMDSVTKAIRNGKYENEDLFDSLELYLKQLQTLINDLSTKAVAIDATPKPNEQKEVIEVFTTFNKNLI
ncbi:MAG: HK97 family phage prohead protease [Ferruginibacter sp.]|nr:HK97 family phage prohead protease [Ferruginibacter sp.]